MYTVCWEPADSESAYAKPLTILAAAREARIAIQAPCGGLGSCGKCLVRVDSGGPLPVSDREKRALSQEEIAAGYRLACQTIIESDTTVYVPEMSRPLERTLQVDGRERPVECRPPVRAFSLDLGPPTLDDTRPDLRRVAEQLSARHAVHLGCADYAVLPLVGPVLRDSSWHATASLRGPELIHITPGAATRGSYGIAVDLGTTRIAFYLVDLTVGETVEARGVSNPQIDYGEDIITRITHALARPDAAHRLQACVIETINQTIGSVCQNHGLSALDVLEIVVVANTAMHHFFLGLPTEQLGHSPHVPILAQALHVKARDLGIRSAPGAYVYCPPPVAGFVGSDHVAMVLASALCQTHGHYLAIDIGTNTEISLRKANEILTASCASGPAFEGAAITSGMAAAPGAIDRVWIEPRSRTVQFSTIGGEPPLGICGSGILDAVAAMRRAGMLDHRGRILDASKSIRSGSDLLPELVLFEAEDGRAITVTQQDVQRIRLAKAAIRSGIEVLLDAATISIRDIDKIVLAGGFGTFLDPRSAVQIGMLPPIDPDQVVRVGNAAGIGAKQLLISTEQRQLAETLAAEMKYLELTVYPGYPRLFAHALLF